MELLSNQAALILTADENGEITVGIATSDHDGLPGALCQALAYKLTNDENFQTELMDMLEEEEGDS